MHYIKTWLYAHYDPCWSSQDYIPSVERFECEWGAVTVKINCCCDERTNIERLLSRLHMEWMPTLMSRNSDLAMSKLCCSWSVNSLYMKEVGDRLGKRWKVGQEHAHNFEGCQCVFGYIYMLNRNFVKSYDRDWASPKLNSSTSILVCGVTLDNDWRRKKR